MFDKYSDQAKMLDKLMRSGTLEGAVRSSGMKRKWLIVGAGYAGATFARLVADHLDEEVLVIDRRDHIGGNAYDYYDENGILIHKYGPHIFHTNSDKVWRFLNLFSDWIPYEHTVLGHIDGKLVHIPFNLNSIRQCFAERDAVKYEQLLISTYGYGATVPILKMREHRHVSLGELAGYIYDKVFVNYTKKQWGRDPESLAASVTARVPVVVSHDNRYFRDKYQAMPKEGYTRMFERMLAHPKIETRVATDFNALRHDDAGYQIVYTGPLDEYFSFSEGHLPYRSLRFVTQHVQQEYCQPTAVVNYPNDHDYTRVTEMKRLTGQKTPSSCLIYEYPQEHVPGENEPYYPIPAEESKTIHERYDRLLDAEAGRVIFVGRLADYRYYNMDQVVARVLSIFEKDVLQRALPY